MATYIIASDNFNRANAGLGANWTTVTGMGNPQIVSNVVQPVAVGNDSAAYYSNAGTWPNDQWSQLTIGAAGTSDGAEVLVRVGVGAKTFYTGHIGGPIGATAAVQIRKYIAGVRTNLTTSATFTLAANDVFRLEVSGSNLTLYQNNVSLATAFDSDLAGGSPGLYVYVDAGLVTDANIDNWSGGGFGNPIPLGSIIT